MKQVLYNVDSKQKTRQVTFEYIKTDEGYTIYRNSGLVGGAIVSQPSLVITKGKASRTLDQQVTLEFNALISKAKDKGYKETIEEVGSVKTDSNGNRKPMLAKDPRGKILPDVSEEKAREIIISRIDKIVKGKKGYMSKKLDGVRMLDRKPTEGLSSTSSRGGKSYDAITLKMIADPCIEAFFEKYPDYQLDGEIYKHGLDLETISGSCRKKVYEEARHGEFQFWVFDILADGLTFEERLEILREIQPETNSVIIVDHIEVSTVEEIMKLHDEWVALGFEGGIWRDAASVYKDGKDNRMLKIKLMQDDEFEIVGISEGLRPEDMVFIMKMPDGKTFEAKPRGTVEKRLEYLAEIDSLKGQMGTVKFFYITDKGVPNLPVFKNVRAKDE